MLNQDLTIICVCDFITPISLEVIKRYRSGNHCQAPAKSIEFLMRCDFVWEIIGKVEATKSKSQINKQHLITVECENSKRTL